MKIYEIKIIDEHRTLLSKIVFDQFVVLADNFNEATKKANSYIKNMTPKDEKTNLIIKSIDEKYVIKSGL